MYKLPVKFARLDRSNPLTRGLDMVFMPLHRTHNVAKTGAPFTMRDYTRIRGSQVGQAYSTDSTLTSLSNPQFISTDDPILSGESFTILTGVLWNDFAGATFGNIGGSGGALYSQRVNDADISPTLCVSDSSFAGGSAGTVYRPWLGTDTAGTAYGCQSTVAVSLNTPYVIGGRYDSAGGGYAGFSVFVNGQNTTSGVSTTAGSANYGWNGAQAAFVHQGQWPDASHPGYLLAGLDMAFMYRWRRPLTDAEIFSASQHPGQVFASNRRRPRGRISVQFLQPISDISAGVWTPSTGTDLYAMLNEAVADDSNYITTAAASTCETKVGVGSAPGVTTGHIARYRIKGTGTLTVFLMQGTTIIASWVHSPAPATYTTYAQTLTGPQAAAISDYTDLRFRYTAS